MTPFLVLVVERNRLFREGLKRIFEGSPFEVRREASNFDEVLASTSDDTPPDLVLADLADNGASFVEQIATLRGRLPNLRIVVLTDRISNASLATALDAGVDGYLLKDMSADALQQSLRLVMLGEKVFPTGLAHLLIAGRMKEPGRTAGSGLAQLATPGLSDREVEILTCLLNGMSNKVIANQLHISEGTVKVHLKGILKKIHVRNRTQAAIWAINNGIHQNAEGMKSMARA
jgi:two-component system, NarL family, nitrate/nitrite response regulator NarL